MPRPSSVPETVTEMPETKKPALMILMAVTPRAIVSWLAVNRGRGRQAERRAQQHDAQDHGQPGAVKPADPLVNTGAIVVADQRAHSLHNPVGGQIQEGLQLIVGSQHQHISAAVGAQHGV